MVSPTAEYQGPKHWSDVRRANVNRALAAEGLIMVERYEPGAEQWCSGSLSYPERGADSWGDCAECGEDLVWVARPEDRSITRIVIEGGGLFDGTPAQFADSFFSNVTEAGIRDWAASHGWSVEIHRS